MLVLYSCTRFYCNFAPAYKINKKLFVAITSCIKAGSEFALSISTTFRLSSKTIPCLGQKYLFPESFFYYFIAFGFYKFKAVFSFLRGCFWYILEFKVFKMTSFQWQMPKFFKGVLVKTKTKNKFLHDINAKNTVSFLFIRKDMF